MVCWISVECFCFLDKVVDTGTEKEGGFKVFRQEQRTSQFNHVKLRFKTIHATGLILLAQGSNKKDFVSVELFRGKVR